MRTNIDIDDELLKEAMAATGQSTKRATVEEALRRVVKLYRQKRAGADLAGIGWEGDLEEMRKALDGLIAVDSSIWIATFPQRYFRKSKFAARAVRAGASVGWRHRIPGSAAWCVPTTVTPRVWRGICAHLTSSRCSAMSSQPRQPATIERCERRASQFARRPT